jgi:hypothetical protein
VIRDQQTIKRRLQVVHRVIKMMGSEQMRRFFERHAIRIRGRRRFANVSDLRTWFASEGGGGPADGWGDGAATRAVRHDDGAHRYGRRRLGEDGMPRHAIEMQLIIFVIVVAIVVTVSLVIGVVVRGDHLLVVSVLDVSFSWTNSAGEDGAPARGIGGG